MPNLLQNQSSPYLKSHSSQTVEWMPWGKEAFQLAEKMDKPLLVSIGYASCHWCSQMSRENYEDSYVASLMNRHFICLKVDREERPDLDLIYMEASRMFNQSAGWPMHAFCLADGSPFWCGTFFPKEDNGQGIAPWPQVLLRIAEHFRTSRTELEENGKNALANLIHSNHSHITNPGEWSPQLLRHSAETLCDSHDDRHGGFTPAPKFPSPMKLDFLLAMGESKTIRKDAKFLSRINNCLETTLLAMARGGLFDHLHGGFFRYCTDQQWTSPHFEKMLSDNALLVSTYSRAWRRRGHPIFELVVRKSLEWIERDLGNTQQGFASSLSAESNESEGEYYLWDEAELTKYLGDSIYKKTEGNWRSITAEKNPLFLPTLEQVDGIPGILPEEIFSTLAEVGHNRYPLPARDEIRSCHQHALLAHAFLDAGSAFGQEVWIEKAYHILQWMKSAFLSADGSVCSIRYPDQSRNGHGFLEDYSLWAEAMLSFASVAEVFGFGTMDAWIEQAEDLVMQCIQHFKDPMMCGFFSASKLMSDPGPVQKKSWFDHAVPSGNSSLLHCFSILSVLSKNHPRWKVEFEESLAAYPKLSQQAPDGIGHALTALTHHATGRIKFNGPKERVMELAGYLSQKDTRRSYFQISEEECLLVNQSKIEVPYPISEKSLNEIFS